ncbi:MAG: hypothetical protein ACLFUL_14970 [Desulfobacteraceae bacterium]
MQELVSGFQHLFNPLHIYCRLLDTGFSRCASVQLCQYYERFIFRGLSRLSTLSVSYLILTKERISLR